jgi:hypothetical protein
LKALSAGCHCFVGAFVKLLTDLLHLVAGFVAGILGHRAYVFAVSVAYVACDVADALGSMMNLRLDLISDLLNAFSRIIFRPFASDYYATNFLAHWIVLVCILFLLHIMIPFH